MVQLHVALRLKEAELDLARGDVQEALDRCDRAQTALLETSGKAALAEMEKRVWERRALEAERRIIALEKQVHAPTDNPDS